MRIASDRNAETSDPHETAMPSSPLHPSPPDATKPNSPLLENGFLHSKEKDWTRFDEQKLRLLAEARRQIELKLANGWGSNLTEDEILEHHCAAAGVAVATALDVWERSRKRPQSQTLGASA